MQYSFKFLSAILLPALATAQSFPNSTISAPPTDITSFPTLIPIHSFPNGTNNTTRPVSTRSNVTRTVTGSNGVVSTETSVVIVSPTDDSAASSPVPPPTTSVPNSANNVGNAAGAFAIGMVVLLAGRLL